MSARARGRERWGGGAWGPTRLILLLGMLASVAPVRAAAPRFEGRFFRGEGDVEYLRLLDVARRMFAPDPEFQHVAMLYHPAWNGFVEGPTWDAWWIQNSYGTTYAALPFYEEPYATWLQNAQDLWFDQMGDGRTPRPFRQGERVHPWVPPDGALCDAARPGWFVAKQGDGRVDLHDWGMEFTAAGLLLQAERLLVGSDPAALARYLPKLERCAAFIETRRDPTNHLFLAGPAANLLAPSYAGWKKPDGTYGMAYLTGLSVTYIAALDRLRELHLRNGEPGKAARDLERRSSARNGLQALLADDRYFIRSLDPDGVRHGVFNAPRHGYFEASPNHDAICFRVAEDDLARRIFAQLASIPGLRPHQFVLPNYPGYDDLYEPAEGLWAFGTWVNGGHWSTCEARMILAYYRLGQFEDARRSMTAWLRFARRFRLDNPLTQQGAEVYQPKQPINLTYDAFGPPAALLRGLFEYLYRAERLVLAPHIPPGITRLEQKFPVHFGAKRLYLSTVGSGPVTAAWLNGEPWRGFNAEHVALPYARLADDNHVVLALGGATPERKLIRQAVGPTLVTDAVKQIVEAPGFRAAAPGFGRWPAWLQALHARLVAQGLGFGYEAAHARLALECMAVTGERQGLLRSGALAPLPGASAAAADQLYTNTVARLCEGLESTLKGYRTSSDARRRRVFEVAQP